MVLEFADQYNDMVTNYPLVTASFTSGSLAGVGDAIAQLREGKKCDTEKQYQQQPRKMKQTTLHLPTGPLMTSNFDTKRNQRFIVKGLGGGLIWLFWFRIADAITQKVIPFFGGESAGGVLQAVVEQQAAGVEDLHGYNNDMMITMIGSSSSSSTTVTIWSTVVLTTLLSILLDQFLASPVVFALWDIPLPLILSKALNSNKDHVDHNEANAVDFNEHIESKLGGLLVENAKVWTIANAIIYNLPLEYRVLASSMTDLVWQSIVSDHVNTDTVVAGQDMPSTSSAVPTGSRGR